MCTSVIKRDHPTTMNSLHAQVEDLLKKRYIVSPKVWQNDLDKLRTEVFGHGYQDIQFPVKLHMLTSEVSFDPEMYWLDDGKSFVISREGYQNYIMSIFFDQTTIRSFQNLLKRYGFRTESLVNIFPLHVAFKYSIYSHPLFARGHQDLSFKMKIGQQENTHVKDNGNGELTEADDDFLDLGLLCRQGSGDSFCQLVDDMFDEKDESRCLQEQKNELTVDSFQHHIDHSDIGIDIPEDSNTDCSSIGSSLHISDLDHDM